MAYAASLEAAGNFTHDQAMSWVFEHAIRPSAPIFAGVALIIALLVVLLVVQQQLRQRYGLPLGDSRD
jgi:hypothetical protein